MIALSAMEVLGAWISIFLTLSVLSFLYDDNPIYKVTEHLFIGVSIGYGVVESFWSVFKPNMLDKLAITGHATEPDWIYLIPLALSGLLLMKATKRYSWLARIPIAILVAAYAAVKVTGEASGKLILQVKDSIPDLAGDWEKYGFWSWQDDGAGLFSSAFLVLGLMAALIHFYFSEIPEKMNRYGFPLTITVFVLVTGLGLLILPLKGIGVLAVAMAMGICAGAPFLTISPWKPWLTRFGILVLMLSFGASFGFTVMGRISLAIGRAQHLMGKDLPPAEAAQIHPGLASLMSLTVIIMLIAFWKKLDMPTTKT